MAKSLTSILSQIERLQKEAASIQSEVVARIRRDIAKYGLTAEQLFGAAVTVKPSRAKPVTKAAKAPKYADGTGNTWGGMGKRPGWIREALDAGKSLEDFLIAKASKSAAGAAKARKVTARQATAPTVTKSKLAAARKPAAKKLPSTKRTANRKPRTKAAEAPAPV